MNTLINTKHSLWYLFLSCLSGALELGVPFLAFRLYGKPRYLLMAAIGYQVTSYSAKYLPLPSLVCVCSAALGTCLLAISWPTSFLLYVLSAFFISLGLHYSRERAKHNSRKVTTFKKRAARVIGFAASGVFSVWMLAIIGCCSIVGSLQGDPKSASIYKGGKVVTVLGINMAVHQIHYFVYCYVMFYWVILHLSSYVYLCGLVFSIGWLSYLLSEPILKRFNRILVLSGGHVSLTVLLLLVAFTGESSIMLLIVLWFLTGFGGGTVFCLRSSNQEQPKQNRVDMDRWEDIGHVGGVVLCTLSFVITDDLRICFVIAGAMAFITALIYIYFGPKSAFKGISRLAIKLFEVLSI